MKDNEKDRRKPDASFTVGAIALVFLAIGYQTALFIQRATVARVVGNSDHPDTVYICASPYSGENEYAGLALEAGDGVSGDSRSGSGYGTVPGTSRSGGNAVRSYRKNAPHSEAALKLREKYAGRSFESFRFNPNTVTVEELMRLGFTLKQAQSIDNYRKAGGHFNRKEDFARSYVVADSVFRRLEPYIDIPALDINHADSAAFDALPGLGPYFASRMVSYRERLGGYSCVEQLLEIPNFGEERLEGLRDMLTLTPPAPFRLWSLPEDSLALHPHLDRHAAHAVVIFRENSPLSSRSVERLREEGILTEEQAERLSRCLLE